MLNKGEENMKIKIFLDRRDKEMKSNMIPRRDQELPRTERTLGSRG